MPLLAAGGMPGVPATSNDDRTDAVAPLNPELQRLTPYGRLRYLTRDSSTYGIAGVLNRALSLITFPLLSRYFTVEEFGILDLTVIWVGLLTVVMVFGQDSAVARHYSDAETDDERRQVASQSLAWQLALMAVVLPPLWHFSDALASRFIAASEGTKIIRLALLQVPFFVMVNFSQNLLKWTFRRQQFMVLSLGSAAGTVAALIVALTVLDSGLLGAMWAYVVVRCAFGAIGIWYVRQSLGMPRNGLWLRRMLPYALAMGAIACLAAVQPVIERSVILANLTDHDLGLYAAAAKVGLMMGLPINAFQTAWGPFSLALHKEIDSARTYRAVLIAYSLFVFASVLALSALAWPLMILLASHRYTGAAPLVFAVALAVGLTGLDSILGVGISFAKKAYLSLVAYGISIAMAFLLLVFLAPRVGLLGVAYAAVAGALTKIVLEAAFAERVFPMRWPFHIPLLFGGITVLFGGISQRLLLGSQWQAAAIVAVCGIVLLIAGGWFVALEEPDRRRLRGLIARHQSSGSP